MGAYDAENIAEFRNFLKSFGVDNVTEEEYEEYLKSLEAYFEEHKFAEEYDILDTDVESVKNGSMTLQEAQKARRRVNQMLLDEVYSKLDN